MELFRRLSELADGPERGRLERQYPIADPETGEFLGRTDLAYPDANVAIEYNGRRHHNPRTAEHDEQRKDGIETVGWTVEETGRDAQHDG
jgi:very-short-patch-repair endonuclease